MSHRPWKVTPSMALRTQVPDFAKVALKAAAFHLWRLADRVFQGPFDKYDFQARQVLRRCLGPDSNCIDVGAHAGHILREMLAAAPRGRHIAIEPVPRFHALLARKYGGRVTLVDCALSDREGEVEFVWFPERPALSGFRERRMTADYRPERFRVRTRRLDDLVPAGQRIDLLKIDVEGAELQVLQGATETLRSSRPIVLFETGPGGADEYGTRPEEVFDLLTGAGLVVSVMEYWLARKPPLSREEFVGRFLKGYDFFFIAYPLAT
jgi:FkbM family methyltransferase